MEDESERRITSVWRLFCETPVDASWNMDSEVGHLEVSKNLERDAGRVGLINGQALRQGRRSAEVS
jgi:hypothetical protein